MSERHGNGQFAPGSNGTILVVGITEEEFDHAFHEAEVEMKRDHGPEGQTPIFAEQVSDSAATPTPSGYGGAAFSEYMRTAAVETARRSFERELRDLEEVAKQSVRKLAFEGADKEKESDGSALDYEGCMQGAEMMLEEFGEEV